MDSEQVVALNIAPADHPVLSFCFTKCFGLLFTIGHKSSFRPTFLQYTWKLNYSNCSVVILQCSFIIFCVRKDRWITGKEESIVIKWPRPV